MEPKLMLVLLCFSMSLWDQASPASHFCASTYYVAEVRTSTYYEQCGSWWSSHRCARQRQYYVSVSRSNPKSCCSGWKGYNTCDIPVCVPSCQNKGLCIAPNRCECPNTVTGGTCQAAQCSYALDCYPGICVGGTRCQCAAGFFGTNCQTVRVDLDFNKCRARLMGSQNGGGDAELLETDCGSVAYSNAATFSSLRMDWNTIYEEADDLPNKPPYINIYRPGVIDNYARITTKNRDGSVLGSSQRVTCLGKGTSAVPVENADCKDVSLPWTRGMLNGQQIIMELHSVTGGFKTIRNQDTGQYTKKVYSGRDLYRTVTVTFDLDPPFHCLQKQSCDNMKVATPLDIGPDVRKHNNVTLMFIGWNDTDSGLTEIKYSVYRLEMDGNKLEETSAPIHTGHIDLFAGKPDPHYLLPSKGAFSIRGTILDRAGNAEYCRALVLYDDVSELETTEQAITMAETERDSEGRVWVQTVGDQSTPLAVSWKGRFKNKFIKNNDLLAPVQPIAKGVDDTKGNFSVTNRLNIDGVVKFEYGIEFVEGFHSPEGDRRRNRSSPIPGEDLVWKEVTPVADGMSVGLSRKDGDSFIFWLRATDVFDDYILDHVAFSVDSTAPEIQEAKFHLSESDSTHKLFYSRVSVKTYDESGGIARTEFQIYDATISQQNIIWQGSEDGQLSEQLDPSKCTPSGPCNCIPTGECYLNPQYVYIHNCWLKNHVDKKVVVGMQVYNRANLKTQTSLQLGTVRRSSWKGLEQPPPLGMNMTQEYGIKAYVELSYEPTCYTVKAVHTSVYTGNYMGRQPESSHLLREKSFEGNISQVVLDDLHPFKEHTVVTVLEYEGGGRSQPLSYAFRTTESPVAETETFGVGAIVGVVLGVLILVAIVTLLVIIVLRRRSHQPLIPDRVRKSVLNRFSRSYSHDQVGLNNVSYERPRSVGNDYTIEENTLNVAYLGGPKLAYNDDDIYTYGELVTDPEATWKRSDDTITMGKTIATGRFAEIKKALIVDKNGNQTVAAKLNKVGATEEDRLLMKAKMNFLATAVPVHENLVNFVGAIVEGPVVLLEYCGQTLKEWLREKSKVTDDVLEQMTHFSADIARGMEHLAKNGIVHRRLGARNVLIKTSNIREIAKIIGYGPMTGEHTGEAAQGNVERIPIKWMAPEQLGVATGEPRHYDEKTDVWSFAITIWEIFNIGGAPYPNVKSSDLKERLDAGYRLPCPDECPPLMYEQVLLPCWRQSPDERPDFAAARTEIEAIFFGVSSGDEYYAGVDCPSDRLASTNVYDDTGPM